MLSAIYTHNIMKHYIITTISCLVIAFALVALVKSGLRKDVYERYHDIDQAFLDLNK
jgi:hypothetical protein